MSKFQAGGNHFAWGALIVAVVLAWALRAQPQHYPIGKVAPEVCEHNGLPVDAKIQVDVIRVKCSDGVVAWVSL